MKYYVEFWKRAFDFKGVASRTQYWLPVLLNVLIGLILSFILLIFSDGSEEAIDIFISIFGIIVFIPNLSICVRRLHDHNRSGWMYLISFIPVIGGIIIFIFMLQGTVKQNNVWRMFDIQRGYIKDEIFTEPLAKESRWVYQDYDEK